MKENYFSKLLVIITICILSFHCSKEQSFERANDGNITISMKGTAFNPETARIVQGATVTWANDDNRIHRVVNDNMNFDSGEMEPGTRFSVTFNEVGNYNYRCVHHPGMASILVLTR